MTVASSILPNPLQPGLLRICPYCNRWWGLRFVAPSRENTASDRTENAVSRYRCAACGADVEFIDHHPPRVV